MRSVVSAVCLASATESKQWFEQLAAVPLRFRRGGRVGTARLSLEAFARRFGDPHEAAPVEDWRDYEKPLIDGAGKVSARWFLTTPRGLVEVSDYWWNPADELSIRAVDRRAVRWARRYFRELGIETS